MKVLHLWYDIKFPCGSGEHYIKTVTSLSIYMETLSFKYIS